MPAGPSRRVQHRSCALRDPLNVYSLGQNLSRSYMRSRESRPICHRIEFWRGTTTGIVTPGLELRIPLFIIYLHPSLRRRFRVVWWNFSLMRKYPVELQAYRVLNFSLMGYEVR